MRTRRSVCTSIVAAMAWIGPLAAISSAQLCFNPVQNYAAGASPLSIVAAYLNGDGNLDLAVVNYNAHRVTILMNHGDGTYPDTNYYGVGATPKSVVAADLDGDGYQDLAVANYSTQNISILLNNGIGRFADPVNVPLVDTLWPTAIAAADLDGDGDQDLAVTTQPTAPYYTNATVTVLLRNVGGTYSQASYSVLNEFNTEPNSVIAADLDGDGDADLAVTSNTYSLLGGDVSVLKNKGNGTFDPRVAYTTGTLSRSVFAADLNGDGDRDLAVANAYSVSPYAGGISVLTNNGSGVFIFGGDYATGNAPYSVCAADMDGDGDRDLAAANQMSNNVSVLLNDGLGVFAPGANLATGSYPMSVLAADLDGDGHQDLAVANRNQGTVSVFINAAPHAGPDKVLTCAVTQINLSGSSSTPEAAFSWAASNGGHIVSGAATATPLIDAAGTYALTTTDPANGCTAADIALVTEDLTPPNADAGPDQDLGCGVAPILLFGSSTTPGATFSWLASDGGAIVSGSTTATPLVITPGTYTLTVTDPDNSCTATDVAVVTQYVTPPTADAGPDKVLGCGAPLIVLSGSSTTPAATYSWIASDGGSIVSGSTTATPTVSAPGTYTLTVTDPATGCTAIDVAVVTQTPPNANAGPDMDLSCGAIQIHLSGSSSTVGATFNWVASDGGHIVTGTPWYRAALLVDEAGTYTLTVTDPANGCTSTDVALVTRDATNCAQALCFGSAVNYAAGDDTLTSVFAADLDGDHDADLAVAGFYDVKVLKNNGDGTFAAAESYVPDGPYPFPSSVFAADLDGDGDADLAVADEGQGNVWVLKNDGYGSFATVDYYAATYEPHSVFAAKLDGDNDVDLAVAAADDNGVAVLMNIGDGTFAAAVWYRAGYRPEHLTAADLERDGDQDLVVTDGSYRIMVLKNDGNGVFAEAVEYDAAELGVNTGPVLAADLDRDGDADLAVGGSGWDIWVLTNKGDGTFEAPMNYACGSGTPAVFAADFDGDGNLDLAAANGSKTISVLRNNGNGTFAASVNFATGVTYPSGSYPYSLFAADLDGDNDADLAVANHYGGGVSIIINCLDPAYTPTGWNISKNLANGVQVTFPSVAIAGGTSSATSSSGPTPPSGFSIVPTASPVYYDIQTTASYTPPVTVCFNYDEAWLSGPEADLRLMHYEGECWIDHTVSQDLVSNIICGSVSSLSPFILVQSSCSCPSQGDINGDTVIDVFDVIGIIGIAFSGDPDPQDAGCPKTRGDVDNNGVADVFDVIYLIATAFSGGANPVDPCGL